EGVEPPLPGSEPGGLPLTDPRVVLCFGHSSFSKVRGEGVEPSRAASKTAGLPLADPRECPAGVEPAFPGWEPGAWAARPRAQVSGKRGSRTLKALRLGRFRGGCHRQLACLPVSVSEAGFEPAFSSVRGTRPLQTGPLAVAVRTVGFEPTLSSTPSWRIAK